LQEILFKYNQRAQTLEDNSESFSFGIIINKIENKPYSFHLVNEKKEPIKYINLNEWKIFRIWSVYSGHSDPPFRDTDPPLSEVQFFKEHFKEHREDANLSFFS